MTKYVGTGKNGKRLWLRTKDNRWIEVPYGAQQDTNIRSLNVWDGTQWMTPTWGWYCWQRYGTSEPIDSLEVRTPDVDWYGWPSPDNLTHYWNPNYVRQSTAQMFTASSPGWTRLFHLEPRNDPNWLIVPIGSVLPRQVPNRTANLYNSNYFRIFWPAIGYHSYANVTRDVPVATENFGSASNGGTGTMFLARRQYNATDPTVNYGGRDGDYDTWYCTTLDLKAIRKRMIDTFPEQSTFYIGQYKPISSMQLRRTILRVRAEIRVSMTGLASPEGLIDALTFRVWARANASTESYVFYDPYWSDSRELQYPADRVPTGTKQWEVSGAELDNRSRIDFTTSGRHTYTVTAALSTEFTSEWTFTAPGEDNISFYPEVVGVPSIVDPNVDTVTFDLRVYVDRVAMNYATAGHDVPQALQTWDAQG